MTRPPPDQQQLQLDVEPDDDLSFHDWFLTLPRTPQNQGGNDSPHRSPQENRRQMRERRMRRPLAATERP